MQKFDIDPQDRLALEPHTFGEYGGVNKSIEASTTFTVKDAEDLAKLFNGGIPVGVKGGSHYIYGRHFNPTVLSLGHELAALEGTEAAYCCASGMAAISSTIMQICNKGDHIVCSDTVYGGTFALLHDYLPLKMGIDVTFVSPEDPNNFEKAITKKTKLIYTEVLSNPTLKVANLPEISKICKKHGILFVVDNTFTPVIVSPVKHGADIVVYSMTKYINGASDIIAGAICASQKFIQSLMDLHTGSLMLLGPTMDPQIAFQISMRLPHLPLRMKAHCARSQYLAEKCAKVKGLTVNYPGLKSHPQYELWQKLLNPGYGNGGMITLDVGSKQKAFELLHYLQNKSGFGFIAVSLGNSETLMSCSAQSTSSEMPEEDLKKAGITPGLLRISAGYTGTDELRWKQLKTALIHCGYEVSE